MCECEKPRQKPAAQNRSNQFIEHIQISSQPFVSVQHAIKSTAYCLNYYSTCSLFRRIIKYAYIFAFDSRLTMTTTATWLQVLPISGHNVTILMLATCSRNMHSSEYELRKHWVWSLGIPIWIHLVCCVRFLNESKRNGKVSTAPEPVADGSVHRSFDH